MDIHYQDQLNKIEGLQLLFETTGCNMEYQLSKGDFESVLQNSSYIVAAYSNDDLVGFGRIVADGVMHAMIYDLITDPKDQKFGIGSEILIRLIKICQENNIHDIQLFCAKGKKMFYEERGFRSRDIESSGIEYGETR